MCETIYLGALRVRHCRMQATDLFMQRQALPACKEPSCRISIAEAGQMQEAC